MKPNILPQHSLFKIIMALAGLAALVLLFNPGAYFYGNHPNEDPPYAEFKTTQYEGSIKMDAPNEDIELNGISLSYVGGNVNTSNDLFPIIERNGSEFYSQSKVALAYNKSGNSVRAGSGNLPQHITMRKGETKNFTFFMRSGYMEKINMKNKQPCLIEPVVSNSNKIGYVLNCSGTRYTPNQTQFGNIREGDKFKLVWRPPGGEPRSLIETKIK